MSHRPKMNEATRAQVEAARPDASTWLSANAGSGKTRVLTNRVARLLLEGTNPQRILCLTYTRAAASEMQNRLFETLGDWAMMDNDKLKNALEELGLDGAPDDDALRRARRLFAQAIETPGGLKIQTIHSFCAALLRRFPLEAGVSPQFTEAEERATEILQADIIDAMADGPEAGLVEEVAEIFRGDNFQSLTKEILGFRERFSSISGADLKTALKLDNAPDMAALPRFVIDENTQLWWPEAIDVFAAQSKTMVDLAGVLKTVDVKTPTIEDLEKLSKSLLVADRSRPNSKVPTKKAAEALGPLEMAFHDLMQRVAEAADIKLRHSILSQSETMLRFAKRFIDIYQDAMQMRGWLDFDDLIMRAQSLLSDKAVAQWVLYRIDGGIDHILVDEAQDTSPRQWSVIEALAAEFATGEGARADKRTIFVVGDKKQSIYSFQGADPKEFDQKREAFGARFESANEEFQRRSLAYSFRSSSAVLQLVDQVLESKSNDLLRTDEKHIAFKSTLPGRVDLWPLVLAADKPDEPHWTDPVDRPSPQSPSVMLADKIADHIKTLCDGEHYLPEADRNGNITRRPITPGDFLILVESRGPIFEDVIRACKAAKLPMAGADRLKVGAELAVRDIAAVLSFLATPQDSLSLATALRSPLFGWSEQALFTLAHHREEALLWPALRAQEAQHPETLAMLHDLRGQVDFLRPYDLIERILTRHDGRRKLIARLGSEAEDGIDALLGQALSYERGTVPSLTGFLSWLEADDMEIKRQIDAASDQVRVMTVHGSKGLEAPIVIMPQTTAKRRPDHSSILKLGEVPVWKQSGKFKSPTIMQAQEAKKRAEDEERMRLLYVAMTRAEKWLIVASAGDSAKSDTSWYDRISDAMNELGAVDFEADHANGLRYQELDWDSGEIVKPVKEIKEIPLLEPVFSQSVAAPPAKVKTLSPSDLGGAKALPGEGQDEETALYYGTLVHDLLDRLAACPADARAKAGAALIAERDFTAKHVALEEALEVLSDPTLAYLFSANSLSEVPITAGLNGQTIYGEIDRLVVTDKDVIAIDFKTNRIVPRRAEECPEGILRQMAAYVHALTLIYPDHDVHAEVLWTQTKTLMRLSPDLLGDALTRLDAVPAAS